MNSVTSNKDRLEILAEREKRQAFEDRHRARLTAVSKQRSLRNERAYQQTIAGETK